jgi:hypothetical protein
MAMDGFVRRENIKRYRKLLREVKDEPGRRLIRRLLLEEEQKEVPFQTTLPPTARLGCFFGQTDLAGRMHTPPLSLEERDPVPRTGPI